MRSAVIFLYTSRSVERRCAIAVSAAKAKFCIQFFGLLCKLYFGPFCSRANSCSENAMSVLFMTGKNFVFVGGLLFVRGLDGLVFCPGSGIWIGFLFVVCFRLCGE